MTQKYISPEMLHNIQNSIQEIRETLMTIDVRILVGRNLIVELSESTVKSNVGVTKLHDRSHRKRSLYVQIMLGDSRVVFRRKDSLYIVTPYKYYVILI